MNGDRGSAAVSVPNSENEVVPFTAVLADLTLSALWLPAGSWGTSTVTSSCGASCVRSLFLSFLLCSLNAFIASMVSVTLLMVSCRGGVGVYCGKKEGLALNEGAELDGI